MIRVPLISYPHFHFDTVEMGARKNLKRAELHKKWQDKIEEHYRVKFKDNLKSKIRLEQFNLTKDIEEVKAYDALKKHLTYGMYKYNTSLGRNLDVYV